MEEDIIKKYRNIQKNKAKTRLGLFITSISLCVSATITKLGYDLVKEKYVLERLEENKDENYIETIERQVFDNLLLKVGNRYTKEELSHIKKIEINLLDNMDYSYLNDLTNLEELVINDYSTKPLLDNIDGSIFKNKMKIEIYRKDYKQSFTLENYKFLKDIPYIDSLVLGKPKELYLSPNKTIVDELYQRYRLAHNFSIALNIESDFLESLKNVHNLTLAVDENFSYKYNDLTFLDSLTIKGEPYDVAVFFSNKDLNKLLYSGVIVNYDDYSELVEINNKLDNIVESFKLSKDALDIDKINTAFLCTLDKCEYSTKDEYNDRAKFISEVSEYYYNGYLRGVFENDTQICGNYATLLKALLNRLNIDSYLLYSQTHVWNIVKCDDKYYLFDATWTDNNELKIIKYYTLDENGKQVLCKNYDMIPDVEVAQIIEEELTLSVKDILESYKDLSKNLKWYMASPINTDDYHVPAYIPADLLNIPEFKDTNTKDIEFFSINNEGLIVMGTFNIGFLIMSLMVFYSLHKDLKYYKKKEKELIKEYNKD